MDLEVLILGWQVALFLVTIGIFLSLARTKLTLITTYLFTLFWGFYFYWGTYIASGDAALIPLAVYVFCGVLHVVLTAVSFYQEDRKATS